MSGRVVGNRWDHVGARTPSPLPRVSVIVAHYDQPAELARMLTALARQDYPAELLEVIVADDGSPVAPAVPDGVRLVRQDDRGFRVAAVRNLGARAATGEVLCFLDADTAPEPGYVRAVTRLPALLPEAVAVGRRRHAAFEGIEGFVEDVGPAHELDEPAWLVDAYERSENLLRADDRSYRYVISAVIACSRAFFDETGGFDESFVGYGGEDWEWAHRVWQGGAVLAHVPEAVAWHDGPDWSAREEADRAAGNRQTLRLASAIPVDGSAGRGLLPRTPDLAIELVGRHPPAATFVCVDALLARFPRAAVLVDDPEAVEAFAADPRVQRRGPVAPDARVLLTLQHPVLFDDDADLEGRVHPLGWAEEGRFDVMVDGAVVGTAECRRARRRRERWGDDAGFVAGAPLERGVHRLRDEPHLEPYVGGWGGLDRLV